MADPLLPLWTYDDAGLTVPDQAALRTQAFEALRAEDRLGGDYLFHPEDPITTVIDVVETQLASAYQVIEVVHNSRSPEDAQGVPLINLGSIVGAEIPQRSQSVIVGRLLGNPGTPVPEGSILKYIPNATLWQTFTDYIIGPNGQVDAELESVEFGPIEASISPASSWERQTTQNGWTGFLATEDAAPGLSDPDDEAIRAAIALASTGGGGAATFDADVQNVSAVTGVSYVALFVNRHVNVYDATLDLEGKKARFVIEGGRKQDLFNAIGRTASTGLDTEETGAVQGVYVASDGTEIPVSYSRPVNRRFYLRVQIEGGNPNVPLPSEAECEDIILAAVELRADDQHVNEPVIPEQYRSRIVAAFEENAVTNCVVQARLAPGDPWTSSMLSLNIGERAIIYTGPTAAELMSTTEEPIALTAGMTGALVVDVFPADILELGEDHTTIASLTLDLAPQNTTASFIDADGRLLIRSNTLGASSYIAATGGFFAALGYSAGVDASGTDGDVEVIFL